MFWFDFIIQCVLLLFCWCSISKRFQVGQCISLTVSITVDFCENRCPKIPKFQYLLLSLLTVDSWRVLIRQKLAEIVLYFEIFNYSKIFDYFCYFCHILKFSNFFKPYFWQIPSNFKIFGIFGLIFTIFGNFQSFFGLIFSVNKTIFGKIFGNFCKSQKRK